MRYIPHTEADRSAMLKKLGASSLDALFADIPEALYHAGGLPFPASLSEAELQQHMRTLASKNVSMADRPSFLGAGCYHHYIPAAVDALSQRGEFLTAYTPYQPEASQGTLQAIFEFQTMVSELSGLPVANASLYDGATALVEALFMVQGKLPKRRAHIVVSAGIHPEYLATLKTYYAQLPIDIVEVGLSADGVTDLEALRTLGEGALAFAFQSPTFVGTIEHTLELTETAHALGMRVVQVFDPVGAAILCSPGEAGCDAAVAEGQPLGNPPNFGGPHLGLLATSEEFLRRLPGRLVGETTDLTGKRGYVLTLQTREQHIRRERATSNICTNVGLVALRATIYMALMGKWGMEKLAEVCLERAHYAADQIAAIDGFSLRYPGTPFFREVAIRTPIPASEVNRHLDQRHIIGGFDLARANAYEDHTLLLCFTEMTPPDHIAALVAALRELAL